MLRISLFLSIQTLLTNSFVINGDGVDKREGEKHFFNVLTLLRLGFSENRETEGGSF